MAIVIQELCNGEDGDLVTVDNSAFIFSGLDVAENTHFDTNKSVEGACSIRVRPFYETVYLPVEHRTFFYVSAYVRFNDATPSATSRVMAARESVIGNILGSVRLETNGKLTIRDSADATIDTSALTVTDDQWVRLDWSLEWGSGKTQKLDVFTGTNIHGTTPDETLTGVLNATVEITAFGFGIEGASDAQVWFDRLVIRDDRMQEPLVPDSDLIEELLADLSGHTLDQGQLTWLTAALNDSATTLQVEQGTQVFRGIAEVGEELVYIRSSDQDTNTVTLAPFGRGYQGTTKQAWPVDTRVTFAPRFPRAHLRREINEVILGLYPILFGVGVFEIKNPSVSTVTHTLPSAAVDVLNVKQEAGAGGFWRTLTTYGVNKAEGNLTLDILEVIEPGLTIRVTYSKRLQPLKPGDSFTDSGLNRSAWSCVKYGALHRLVGVQEAGRSGTESAEGAELARNRNPSPAALSRQYYAVFQQLLSEERTRLLDSLEIINNSEYI